MRVCTIGTGYVGLVTGACLAHIGHDVICVDNNPEKVELMKSGHSPIYEPGLSEIMKSAMAANRLQFTTDLGAGIEHGEILFIAVGTPPLPNGSSDTQYVEAVAKGIGQHLNGEYKVIVNKSTVPIGSGDWVKMLVLDGVAERTKQPLLVGGGDTPPPTQLTPQFDVVSNPEFLREGSAIYDTLNPDRIVLGSNNQQAIDLMLKLYSPIIDRECAEDTSLPPVAVLATDLGSAEMIKYAANAFLATKISFINEIANICERVGADVTQVSKGIGLDSRIGNKFLNAGIGWGGSCFPKDLAALIHTGADYGYDARLLKAAVSVNQQQRTLVIQKLQNSLKILKGKTIGLLGLTFKPDTDDLRDAPALDIIHILIELGAKVKAYDPIISPQSSINPHLVNVNLVSSPQLLATDSDALVLMTEWSEFQEINYQHLAGLMRSPIVVDCRNFLSPTKLAEAGFNHIGIGC
ncbi:UDP-glucose dehydrogenase family protein [Chamaesiphon minutus]|uniref:UDP-glucose 6-dehydrogenase n=1 Tax=Chamaesiphon minutus (strain ATCC 27169 / PCC 6605) TaxID=1173020 RepID=K9UAD6_CHAP6|nr:UDP-glucose/GDP-mannose dehydrogenase family protein [Chamaesiphon minutus]AFY91593.1 nucleotide sugar dehydrogenase [Chamaesiphon minutus PCC 6605]